MVELSFDNVVVDLGGARALDGVTLTVRPGALTALIGANGAGKTTLLRAGLGLLAPTSGGVLLDGHDPRRLRPDLRARKAAYLPQARPLAWPLYVRDVVALGRYAFGARASRLTGADADAAHRALAATRLEALADRRIDQLSGGELARAHLARALAAEAPLLLADEPAAMLDPLHAFETLAVLKRFAERGGGALVTLHDLSLAARFADQVALLRRGRLLAFGPPQEVLTPPLLADAFGIRAELADGALKVLGPA